MVLGVTGMGYLAGVEIDAILFGHPTFLNVFPAMLIMSMMATAGFLAGVHLAEWVENILP